MHDIATVLIGMKSDMLKEVSDKLNGSNAGHDQVAEAAHALVSAMPDENCVEVAVSGHSEDITLRVRSLRLVMSKPEPKVEPSPSEDLGAEQQHKEGEHEAQP